MHYYKFNIGDWHLHTSHLTLVEEAVYFRLVNHYYNTEKPFKAADIKALIRRLRLGNESDIVTSILDEFFCLDGENYVHARCEKEIKAFKKKSKVNKANGAKGGRPPVSKGLEGNPQKTQTVTSENPNITLNTNQEPLTTNQEPLIKDIRQQQAPPAIPYQRIVDLFNQNIGDDFPKIRGIKTDKRKRLTKKFYIYMNKNLDTIAEYFKYFSANAGDFYRGRKEGSSWVANFDYIVKDETVEKCREGNL